MPYKESFAWAIVPLFDNSIAVISRGAALAPSVSGSSSHDGVFEPAAKITLDGKLGYSSGISVVVEISNLNKVKESYTEDSLQVWLRCNSFILISFTLSVYKLFMNTLSLQVPINVLSSKYTTSFVVFSQIFHFQYL
jgi:hypothetical protein